ncbi:Tryptophan aminotransferase-related protein [Quillaja saponaria]|uniref:Tryptophan aminotransferase-related protein n=1 Tax=Quillaja saponaria TaxID=32244 RepID=A0AAD7M4D9_QUISA|nr:Tryptophan aminotransferase-related protein [Quillaja saponaria]
MAKTQSFKYAACLTCSILVNLLSINLFLHRGGWEKSWTRNAVEEAEAVASISCSGHGRAFLDGVILHGKPVCECNQCYGGTDCSQLSPNCVVDADSGDPTFLEPYWVKHAASSSIMVAGWHRMSYEFNDGSLISEELISHIRKVHAAVGNANTEGKYIIFGAGATQLLHAATHALSFNIDGTSSPSKVVASTPYYPVYKEQKEFFKTEDYKFSGDTSVWNDTDIDSSATSFIEFVTSPNNPDGQLKKAILQGPSVKTVHDLAYYWPHYTPIPAPADEDVMIFTLSKLTGHAGSRFGWALIKDEAVYKRMLTYMDLSTYGVSRETQLRVLKLFKVALEGNGREMYDFGYNTMRNRWDKLSKSLSKSKRFSIQQLNPQLCSFSQQVKAPTPAFAWLKCEREEDSDCFEVLQSFKITGRAGNLFGAEGRYVRLSLVKTEDDFELLMERIKKLVSKESESEVEGSSSTTLGESKENRKSNESMEVLDPSYYINGLKHLTEEVGLHLVDEQKVPLYSIIEKLIGLT